jgi:thioredoxin reductase
MFYSLGDLNAIKQKIDIVSCVNIVGDGTESLRLAEFFLARDKEVKIIGKNKPDSFIATDKLEWIEGLKPLELIGEGSELKAMKLDNGKVIAASIVLFATNFRPSSSFLKDTDINLEEGYVIIDENMQTNLENIFACGSVCRRSGFLEEKTPDTYNQEGIKIAESIMHYARGEKICQRF